MKTLRVGIIGGGRIGKVHATSISRYVPSAEIVALADPFMNEELESWAKDMGSRRPRKTVRISSIMRGSMRYSSVLRPTPMHS